MIGTPFFGGHVVHWTPYFRGTSLTLVLHWRPPDVHIFHTDPSLLKSACNWLIIKRPARDACLHMGGILAEGSAGSASLPTYSVFTSGWNFFKLGTYI